jgi:Domain of unknown function (DUF4872)
VNWVQYSLDDTGFRMNLFSLYVFVEIGGTGAGVFVYIYARFLNEAATVTGNSELGLIAGAERIRNAVFGHRSVGCRHLFQSKASRLQLDALHRHESESKSLLTHGVYGTLTPYKKCYGDKTGYFATGNSIEM